DLFNKGLTEILLHPHAPKGSSPDIVYYRKRSRSDKFLLIQSFSTSSDTTCEVPDKQSLDKSKLTI
ncbi:hypothetical protein Tco_0289229, partial [Tanacetum coccineum]